MRVVVLGKRGNIARALARILSPQHKFKTTFIGSDDLDLSGFDTIDPALDQLNPNVIINAAAYTNVEKAESDRDAAFQLNAVAPATLAKWCARHDRVLVHYSTDYVFDGSGAHEWAEDMPTGPAGVYAASKLAGERHIQEANCRHLILRTARVYSAAGVNFFMTMLKLMRERETITVVDDQIGHPTYAPHVARATIEVLNKAALMPDFPTGIYHMTNQGSVSWYEFTRTIAAECRLAGIELKVREITPISSAGYPSRVVRPINARMSNEKLERVFGVTLAGWQEGLLECVREIALTASVEL